MRRLRVYMWSVFRFHETGYIRGHTRYSVYLYDPAEIYHISFTNYDSISIGDNRALVCFRSPEGNRRLYVCRDILMLLNVMLRYRRSGVQWKKYIPYAAVLVCLAAIVTKFIF